MAQQNIQNNDARTAEQLETKPQNRATAQSVVSLIRQSIYKGDFKNHDRLPAERQLAEQYNASRGTVRSALQQLEKQNLVVRNSGSGTFVKSPTEFSAEEIVRITSPLEVIEVRIAIEPHMMRLVVANASRNDLDELAIVLERLEQCNNDTELFTAADTQFHITLAECAQNELMLWVYKQISKVREHSQWSSMKDKVLTPERIQKYNQEHRRLYEAITSRHADEAFHIMRTHLNSARADLLGNTTV